MGITNLGPVSMSAGGVYNPETEYKKYKVVSANGGSYMYINPTPAAGVPVTNTSHWQQIAEKGDTGDVTPEAEAARDTAIAQAALAQGYAAQLAAGTASPAGTYANLAALNAGTPTAPNVTKIYITLDDGNWCYWNGSAWVAGGVYQATERPLDTTLSVSGMAADAKVTGDKVGELKSAFVQSTQQGMLMPIGMIPNSYINSSGALVSFTGWKATDYIAIPDLGDLVVYSTGSSRGSYNAFYDENKEFISGSTFSFSTGKNTIRIPESAKFFRLSSTNAIMDTVMYQWWVPDMVKKAVGQIDTLSGIMFLEKSLSNADSTANGYIISDKTFYSSGSWTAFMFENAGYTRINATLGAAGPRDYAIAFYSSTTISAENFIDGVETYNGVKAFDVEVPNGTELIVISNRTPSFENPSGTLYQDVSMTQIDGRLSAVEDKLNVPSYVETEAVNVANATMEDQDAKTLTFAFISDIHYHIGDSASTDGLDHAVDAIKIIREHCNVDKCVNLGDTTYAYHAGDYDTGFAELKDATVKLNAAFFASPTYRLVGNHDVISNGAGEEHITMAQLYSMFGIYQHDLIKPAVNQNAGYGYQDFVNEKLRIICMNTSDFSDDESSVGSSDTYYGISAAQLQWLAQTMDMSEKSDADEWGILILCHVPLDNAALISCTPLLYAYEQGSSFSYSWRGVTVSYDYTGKNDAHFIGVIHGHTHDFSLDNIRAKISGGTIVTLSAKRMAIPNASSTGNGDSLTPDANGITWGTEPRYPKTPNTVNDTTFDVVTIDMQSHIIKAHNYGAGKDRTWDFDSLYS